MKEDSVSFNKYINRAPDHEIWSPILEEEKEHFLSLVRAVEKSYKDGDRKEKGDKLEALMTYVYKRFDGIADVYPNVQHGDNQIDHIIEFVDGMTPEFIYNNVGLRIIGESKNHQKAISVREVADLSELLRYKRAKMGIFSSVNPFGKGKSGNVWQFAEGKRRKLALSRNQIIIGFTLKEIETLTENNFYTMIKHKYFNLVDEVEDEYTDYLEEDLKVPYPQRLYLSLFQLKKNGVIPEQAYEESKRNIIQKYGPIEDFHEN